AHIRFCPRPIQVAKGLTPASGLRILVRVLHGCGAFQAVEELGICNMDMGRAPGEPRQRGEERGDEDSSACWSIAHCWTRPVCGAEYPQRDADSPVHRGEDFQSRKHPQVSQGQLLYFYLQ